MNKRKKEFVEEITTNFSELFVETFLIRYLNEFDKNDLLDVAIKTNNILIKKVNIVMREKLNNMGYNN